MESNGNGQEIEHTQAVISTSAGKKHLDHVSLCFRPRNEEELLDPNQQQQHKSRFLDFLKTPPSKEWLVRLGSVGRSSSTFSFSYLKRIGSQRSNGSSSMPPVAGTPLPACRSFRVQFVREINWGALLAYCKNWVKHPMNMALLVWLFFVGAGLTVLFLLMTGLMDGAMPSRRQRQEWTENINQILNALFTIMCVYQHPRLIYQLVLLCRWRSGDIAELRKVYCKNGADVRPNERAHMLVVVLLLHVTCFSQYSLCALYWVSSLADRPSWPQVLLVVVGIVAPVTASIYLVYSPLGRKYESEMDEELQGAAPRIDQHRVYDKKVVIAKQDWDGGLFECREDLTLASLSFFCTFCVFGWNMERLGFGNMYVHIVTFILLCVAPLLVFSVTAVRVVDDDAVRYVMGAAGVMLCFCGLLYGGFWRIQMRRRLKLPGNPLCCGSLGVTDFVQWLFCWSCSLAQEVRTGNFYDMEEGGLYRKEGEDKGSSGLRPLPREGEVGPVIKSSALPKIGTNPPHTSDGVAAENTGSGCVRINVDEEAAGGEKDNIMNPPLQPQIQQEDLPKN